MSSITRRALRVYTALNELKAGQGDVLDALLPFFEPILDLVNGKVFDPKVFALGVRKLYRWRFTTDIAVHLIPRLVRAGYLTEKANTKPGGAIYVINFIPKPPVGGPTSPVEQLLNEIIDEFEKFSPRLTDLLQYNRSRDELADILIRFLVSLDAYNPATFNAELAKLKLPDDDSDVLKSLDEGGQPLHNDDRYMAARFVSHICKKRRNAVDHLSRLASIGLLTEVVEDFLRPINVEQNVSLTVVVDGPVALDYLGCSGTSLKNDVTVIFDALKGIGCKLVALPITCAEMQRNLKAMLSLPDAKRHGPTHSAMIKREVMPEYIQAVANDPEKALSRAGITVLPIDLGHRPDIEKFFNRERYEDYFSSITWLTDVAPREHDATCLALTMRLREGKHSSDLFKSRYVFVTRNPRFVQHSRDYCLESRLIFETQEGPVVHQRELATIAWLRTGLGVSDAIPRGQLMAACDRVLSVRTEVRDAVAEKLKEFTPDKIEQFELLIADQRSLRRLADKTLNNEKVVTAENANDLLEAMRQATIEEEKQAFQVELDHRQATANERLVRETERSNRYMADANAALDERDLAIREVEKLRASQVEGVRAIARTVTKTVSNIDTALTGLIFLLAACGIINHVTGWLTPFPLWSAGVLSLVGLFSLYHMVRNAQGKPKIGLVTVLGWIARRLFVARLEQSNLLSIVDVEKIIFDGSSVGVPDGAIIFDREDQLDLI